MDYGRFSISVECDSDGHPNHLPQLGVPRFVTCWFFTWGSGWFWFQPILKIWVSWGGTSSWVGMKHGHLWKLHKQWWLTLSTQAPLPCPCLWRVPLLVAPPRGDNVRPRLGEDAPPREGDEVRLKFRGAWRSGKRWIIDDSTVYIYHIYIYIYIYIYINISLYICIHISLSLSLSSRSLSLSLAFSLHIVQGVVDDDDDDDDDDDYSY